MRLYKNCFSLFFWNVGVNVSIYITHHQWTPQMHSVRRDGAKVYVCNMYLCSIINLHILYVYMVYAMDFQFPSTARLEWQDYDFLYMSDWTSLMPHPTQCRSFWTRISSTSTLANGTGLGGLGLLKWKSELGYCCATALWKCSLVLLLVTKAYR